MLRVAEKEAFSSRNFVMSNHRHETTRRQLAPFSHRQQGRTTSKLVTFYKNGDRLLHAYPISITERRYKTFDNLLSELTRLTSLPMGVRYIMSPNTGRQIHHLDEFHGGKSYVCSSYRKLRKLHYGSTNRLMTSLDAGKDTGITNESHENNNNNNSSTAQGHPKGHHRFRGVSFDGERRPLGRHDSDLMFWKTIPGQQAVKPRIVTVIRYGHRPRHVVKVLLNRRTAQTFDQVLNNITAAVGVDGGSGIRKLYDVNGRHVTELIGLFGECDIFLAVGSERFDASQIQNIVAESHERLNRTLNRGPLPPAVPSRKPVASTLHKKGNKLPPIPTHQSEPQHTDPAIARLVTPQTKQRQKYSKLPRIVSARDHSDHASDISSHTTLSRQPSQTHKVVTQEKAERSRSPIKSIGSSSVTSETSSNLNGVVRHNLLADSKSNVENTYEFGKRLGDGNFAVVRQCYEKQTRKTYAVKIIDRKKMRGKEEMLRNEIDIMLRCRHPNIVGLIEHYNSTWETYLIMELVPGGDLFDAISSAVKLSEAMAACFARDIFSALDYLHKRNIVHRDLKPENLMVYEPSPGNKGLKLVDFGLAMDVTGPIFTVCGTPTYVAPEILLERGYGLEVDVWAAGVITYIMLCGFPPFRSPDRRQTELFALIETGEYEFLEPYWDNVSQNARQFIARLLVVDISSRTTAAQCLQHDWLTSMRLRRNNTLVHPADEPVEEIVSPRTSRFKTVALTIQGAQRLKNLAAALSRGERLLTHVS